MVLSKCPHTLNFYLNHSKIKPNIAPDGVGYIDASELLENPDTRFFNFGHGGVLFWQVEPKIYMGDAYFLKGNARENTKAAIREMFSIADKIRAEAASFNKQSMHFITSLGFKRTGIKEGAWSKNGEVYDVIQYELEREWVV